MRLAADFRSMARNALKGKRGIAVCVGLVAMLLGAAEYVNSGININVTGSKVNFQFVEQRIFSIDTGIFIAKILTYTMTTAFIMRAVRFVLGSVIAVGYARFNLNLVDHKESSFENLFAYFTCWKAAVVARILEYVYTLLWSLLLIIPGIIAFLSYEMTEYILADYPELSASEAISRSKQMMEGNKGRLFCLQFSFIGWKILCIFTLGLGSIWLTPYIGAAKAAFYREVSGEKEMQDPSK